MRSVLARRSARRPARQEKSRAIPQAPLAARKPKRRLAVRQEPLDVFEPNKGRNSGEPGRGRRLPAASRRPGPGREACPGSIDLFGTSGRVPL